jgi:hypothetical protein
MFSTDRQGMRSRFTTAWARAEERLPLEPLDDQLVQIAAMHPEYQEFLRDPESLDQDFHPEAGATNPFLHMGLHQAIREQIGLDRPTGIRQLHRQMLTATSDVHAAEHRMMECLAKALWRLQRDQQPFDEESYLRCIRRAVQDRRR